MSTLIARDFARQARITNNPKQAIDKLAVAIEELAKTLDELVERLAHLPSL